MDAPTRKSPRWFVPALVGGMLIAIAALTALGALLYQGSDQSFRVGKRTYIIPPDHLSSAVRDPIFLRIRPPNRPFEIVHDDRAAGRHDRTGVPHIFSLNDGEKHGVRYGRVGRSLVVCKRTPSGECGTWIDYGGATWSVLFSENCAGEAESLVRDAAALLKRYDASSRALVPVPVQVKRCKASGSPDPIFRTI